MSLEQNMVLAESCLPQQMCLVPVWIPHVSHLASSGHCGRVCMSHRVYLLCASWYKQLGCPWASSHSIIIILFPLTAVVQTVVLTPSHLDTRTMHLTQEAKACKSVSQCHLYQPHPSSYVRLLHPETGKLGDSVPRPQFGRSIRVRLCSGLKAACL